MSVHALGPAPEQLPVVLRQHEGLVAAALRAHLDGMHWR